MLQELKFQLSTAILTVVTVAAGVSAAINLQQQFRFRLPDDGVTWVDRKQPNGKSKPVVYRIAPASSGSAAGLQPGDVLTRIKDTPVERAVEIPEFLAAIGIWNKVEYSLERPDVNGRPVEFKSTITIGEVPRDRAVLYQYAVGGAFLIIGLFVYFRRGSAYKARHFYVYCLTSFVASTFHYTGKLNGFDKVIYFGNVVAVVLAPTIFLHFCLTFPEIRPWIASRFRQALLYVPAALLSLAFLGASSEILRSDAPLITLRWTLDRASMLFFAGTYLAGGGVLFWAHRRAEDPIVRQQLKWLRNGVLSGVGPFAILYVIPYSLGVTPATWMKLSVCGLALVPLTIAWAIIRYRLMDVDILFRRGYAYTLATVCVLAGFYAVVFSMAKLIEKNFKELGQGSIVTIMLLAAFLFQPIRSWIQERLDKYFYRERYDYRRTLVEFARELSSETNLDRMLGAAAERLMQTLQIKHLAFFLSAEDDSPGFALAKGVGLRDRSGHAITHATSLDLSFLDSAQSTLFFERTRYLFDAVSRSMPTTARSTIADLDLTYYLPCPVRNRTIAWLGVSRTETGDFLSTVDVELLETLAGYVAIAIENARLYRSLERKVIENARLKEFSENIVESINVGILAADLDDRVESWNSRLEAITGISREDAQGRTLRELFPTALAAQFDRVRGENGIHHIDKFGYQSGTLNIAVAPLISKDSEQIGRLVIFDDVTDRAELERRLVQADKLSSIGLLAAGVAHEVNTPLAVISTYAQMLAKQVAGDDAKSKLLEKIAKQTFRASEIVNSLLNFSRTSSIEFAEVSLNKLAQETLALLEHQLIKTGVSVRVEFDPNVRDIKGNPGKLQQVFLNLFLNARDAMPSGGVLSIRTWSSDGRAHIEVGDSGHGIAAEDIHRIYDPFFTTKAAEKKGTGLGLSVTYGIIQEHNGTIKVHSQPGAGTRFTLDFPEARAAAMAAASPSAAEPVNA